MLAACATKDIGKVRQLIKGNAESVRGEDENWSTALMVACGVPQNQEIVRMILTANAGIVGAGLDPPQSILGCGMSSVMNKVDAQRYVDALNREGQTALMIACSLGHMEAAALLLEFKANVHCPPKEYLSNPGGPFFWTDVLLQEECSDVSTVYDMVGVKAGWEKLKTRDERSKLQNHDLGTRSKHPVRSAAKGNCIICGEVSKHVCGACKIACYCCAAHQKEDWKVHQIVCKNRNLAAELGVKLRAFCSENDLISARKLLDKHPTTTLELRDDVNNRTPLMIACYCGSVKLVVELLSRGAQVNVFDMHGDTPLMLACTKNRVNVVKVLVEHPGINLNYNGGRLFLPLTLASVMGHTEIFELLKSKGAKHPIECW